MVRFRLGAVPVSVHASFLLLAFLGYLRYETLEGTLAWTAAVFLAILVHEAGHAFTARSFGARQVAVMLFGFGGATTYPVNVTMTPGRRFLISAAGSFVGIITGALALMLGLQLGWWEFAWEVPPLTVLVALDFRVAFLISFFEVALVWGVLNWLPMRPLDGGQMLQSLFEIVAPSIAETGTRVVSLVIGVPVIAWAIINQQVFIAMIVGFLLLTGLRRSPAPAKPPVQSGSPPATVRPEVVDDGGTEPGPRPVPERLEERRQDPPEFPI